MLIFSIHYCRIEQGLVEWAKNEDRLKWHKDVDREYMRAKSQPDHVCSSDFISKAAKYGPAEIALQTPFRAGLLMDVLTRV